MDWRVMDRCAVRSLPEIIAVLHRALAAEFRNRLLDAETARHELPHAAFTLVGMTLREVSGDGAQQEKGRMGELCPSGASAAS
jgi:hypothetical protein